MSQRDIERLCEALTDVQRDAAKLPWAKERAWVAVNQVGLVEGVPTVDLHGLSISLGVRTTSAALDLLPDLDAAAVQLITGRGRHTGGISRLKDTVNQHVVTAARENGWTVSPRGPGRILVVADASKAPSAATGRLPLGFWFVVLLIVGTLIAALYQWMAG